MIYGMSHKLINNFKRFLCLVMEDIMVWVQIETRSLAEATASRLGER